MVKMCTWRTFLIFRGGYFLGGSTEKITEQLLLLLLHASQWLKMFYCQSLRFLVGIRYKVLGFSHFFDDKVKSDQNFRTYTFLTKEVFAVRIPRVNGITTNRIAPKLYDE